MKSKKMVSIMFVLVFGMLFTACTGTAVLESVEESASAEEAPEENSGEQVLELLESLTVYEVSVTPVKSGEGLTQAILRNCEEESGQECFWTDYSNLAIFWEGEYNIFIEDIVAFNSLAIFDDLGGTQEGDFLVWGPSSEVMGYVSDNGYLDDKDTVRISSNMVTGENLVIEEVWLSGGFIIQPFYVTHQRYPYEDFWKAYVNGVEMTPADAFALATE